MTDAVDAVLISSSTAYGKHYLDHAVAEIENALNEIDRILFVPYALHDWNKYHDIVAARFAQIGREVHSIHKALDPLAAIARADAVFVGGGNTFVLLDKLHELHVFEALRQRVRQGAVYIGSSAGANIAGVTIQTTNDMPIAWPRSPEALGLVPFNINPHYHEDRDPTHMGEKRDERLQEFHEYHKTPVVALYEGAMLRVAKGTIELRGEVGAKVFRPARAPISIAPGTRLDEM